MKTWIDEEGNMWVSETNGIHTTNLLLGKVEQPEKPKKTKRAKKEKE